MDLKHNLAFVLVSVLIASTAVVAAGEGPDAGGDGVVSWMELDVGDVVAEGVPVGDACHLDPVLVRIGGLDVGAPLTQFLDLTLNDACQLVVMDVGATVPFTSLLAGDGSESRSDGGEGGDGDDGGSGSTIASHPKTVKTEAIHYGNGGTDDILTIKDQTIEYSWSGGTATMESDEGYCTWVAGWVNDACVLDERRTSGTSVYRESHGDFHYDGLFSDDYFHTLTVMTWGYNDGGHDCAYGVSGDIVNGVRMTCQVG